MDGAGRPLWRNVWVMALTIVGTLTAIFSWNRVFWLHLRERGASDVQLAWAAFALVLAYRLPQALGGMISDRLGRKTVVVAGTLGMAAAYVAVAFAPGWRLPVAALCVAWTIGALQWPGLVSLVADSVPEGQRGRAMGLLESGSMIGITVGPLLGESVLLHRESLQAAVRFLLLLSCALYAASGIARGALLREPARAARAGGGGEPIPWGRFAAPAVVTLLMFVLFFLTTDGPVMSLYIKDELRGTEALVQRVGFYGGLGSIAGALLAGWLSDRIGAGRTMALASLATAGLAGLLASGFARPIVFAALFAPGEAFLVAYQKLITSLGPPARRGFAVGVVGTGVGLASSWAMAVSGKLYESGRSLPFVLAAAAGGAACAASLLLCRDSFNGRR